MKSFHLEHRTDGPVDIFQIEGELGTESAYTLEAALLEQMRNGRYCFVINARKLEQIASTGLGMFMARIEEIRTHDGDIKFCNLRRRVYHVFDLLGYPDFFEILDSEEQAVQLFLNREETRD
ncbi:MAG: STAS domain-containing protein [Bacteroidota bacterium]